MRRYLLTWTLLLAGVMPCLGGARALVSPSTITTVTEVGLTVHVYVKVDPGGTGSYGAQLDWNPDVLRFDDWSPGESPFDTPVVNMVETESGRLRFADAAPSGAAGWIRLLSVTFGTIAEPPRVSALDLEFTSLFDGEQLDVLPLLEVLDAQACVADFDYHLELIDARSTVIDWGNVRQGAAYDVVRGALGAWSAPVICLENDSADTTTADGSEPANPDTDVPAPGEGFFYLVRFQDAGGPATYGFLQGCMIERSVGTGDCPF